MIAHKREDGQIQTIPEHLEGTAVLAEEFASNFGAGELGHLAGMAHDIGKYSEDFQKRILENGPKVDHSSAGAYECAIRGLNPAAFSVAGHHTGLPDLGGKDDVEEGTLRGKLNRAKKKMIPAMAEKLSCRLTLFAAQGHAARIIAITAESEVTGSFSRRRTGASSRSVCMKAARTADGLDPVMSTKPQTSAMQTSALFLPRPSRNTSRLTRNAMCSPV